MQSEKVMSFEQSLQAICKEIMPAATDVPSYNEDAEIIRRHIIERMKDRNEYFKNAYNGLSSAEKSQHHWTDELPDEFDVYIKLKMPFTIKPQAVHSRPGFITLQVPARTTHPLVRQNCVSRESLQDWLRNILSNTIKDGYHFIANGRKYSIKYPLYGRGYGVVHTIMAKELHYGKREISFDMVPAFEFDKHEWPLTHQPLTCADETWFAVPFGKRLHNDRERSNEFAFMTCTTDWERKAFCAQQNLRNSLRLMKAIRDVKSLELLTNYMLKSIYLEELEIRPKMFCNQPIGVILIEMLEVVIHALHHNHLPFFLDKRFKQLRLLRRELQKMYPIQLNLILKNLRHFQRQSKVNSADVTIFSFARNNFGRH